jgi:flagellin
MGLRIGTNIASIAAQRNLARSEAQVVHASRALSSGSRIVSPGDDAAGFAISESLRGQAAGLRQAKQNSDNAGGLIQVAEGGLNEQNNILVRLRELAVQAASDTVSDDERGFLDTEFKSLTAEFDRTALTTRYGSKQLLSGSDQQYEFHLGTGNTDADVIKYKMDTDTRASSLGVSGLGVSDKDDAKSSLKDLDDATYKLAKARAGFGAMQSRFQIASNNLDLQHENIVAARSRIADADVAAETANLVQGQVLQEFGISVLAQANQMPQRAIKLL